VTYLDSAARRLVNRLRGHEDVADAWYDRKVGGSVYICVQVTGSQIPRDLFLPFQSIEIMVAGEHRTEFTGELTAELIEEI
jgi:hypothetical protein